jgi:hypothetical protein
VAAREAALALARRHAGLALEESAERAEVAISDALAHGIDAEPAPLEQPLRRLDPQQLHVAERRLARRRLEAPADRARAHGGMIRELGELEAPPQMPRHPALRPGHDGVKAPSGIWASIIGMSVVLRFAGVRSRSLRASRSRREWQ